MAKKPTRLHFTEEEANPQIQKVAERAEKAADKAEKAVGKLSSQKKTHKLRMETDAPGSRKAKLRLKKQSFQKFRNVLPEQSSLLPEVPQRLSWQKHISSIENMKMTMWEYSLHRK